MLIKKMRSYFYLLMNISVTELLFYLYIFSIITLSGMAIGNIISKLIGLAMVFYFIVVDLIRNKATLYFFDESKAVLLFLIACMLSGFFAKDQVVYVSKLITLLQLFLFFIIGYSIIKNYQIKAEIIFYLVIFSTIIVFLQGMIYSSTASAHLVDERLNSAQGNANTLANFGAFSFLFLTYLFINTGNKFKKIFLIFIILIIIVGILKTESRKGLILLPIVVFTFVSLQSIYLYSITKNKKIFLLKFFSIFLIMIIMLGIGIYFITQFQYFERFQQLSRFLQIQSGSNTSAFKNIIDYSTYERRQFIKYGLAMWKENFWFGVGLDNFRSCINEFWISSRKTYSHNNYVEILSTTGILGGFTYYLIYYLIIKNLLSVLKIKNISKSERSLIHIFLTGMYSLLIAEMVIISYYKKFFWLLFILFVVYANILKQKYENDSKKYI